MSDDEYKSGMEKTCIHWQMCNSNDDEDFYCHCNTDCWRYEGDGETEVNGWESI